MSNATKLPTFGPDNAPNPFYTTDGKLTSYALACGYVERHDDDYRDSSVSTRLWREHTVYHVLSDRDTATSHSRLSWETFATLTEARKAVAQHVRKYHSG